MPGPVAILCSGQGAQHRDMFALTGTLPQAEPVFAAATPYLDGVDPREFVRDADEAVLFSNRAGQVLCCTQAIAAWTALGDIVGNRVIIAGYSVGEVAAWFCAGMLDASRTLDLISRRATLMDAATNARLAAGLVAIVGLRRDRLDPMLLDSGCEIAIVNAADSVVAGGSDPALEALSTVARKAGASRVARLRVAVPAHTSWLLSATEGFRAALQAEEPRPPRHPLLAGLDGDRVRDVAEGCDKLARQISQTVDWAACLARCGEAGAGTMLELGPGRVLAGLASAAVPDAEVRALEDFRSLDGVSAWLRRGV